MCTNLQWKYLTKQWSSVYARSVPIPVYTEKWACMVFFLLFDCLSLLQAFIVAPFDSDMLQSNTKWILWSGRSVSFSDFQEALAERACWEGRELKKKKKKTEQRADDLLVKQQPFILTVLEWRSVQAMMVHQDLIFSNKMCWPIRQRRNAAWLKKFCHDLPKAVWWSLLVTDISNSPNLQ